MSTLKKILSLTLALAMLMSVSVFAGFADAGEIDKDAKAAVELLSATNIINGITKEDGTTEFAPNATIKRAEAAKMIYVLCNKGVDDKAEAWQDAVTFADCKGHWAAGYIAYCEAKNLISGRTETSFDPEAPVTGIELAKMLLNVAGYRTEVEGYTGAGWEKNVAADAEAAGLFEGTKFALTQPAPRQWAAKMFANAFKVPMASYIGDYRIEGTLAGNVLVQDKFLDLTETTTVVLATKTASVNGSYASAKTKTVLQTKSVENGTTVYGTREVSYVVDDSFVGQQVKVAEGNGKVYGIVTTGKTISGVLKVSKALTTGDDAGKYPVTVGGTSIGNKDNASIKLVGDANVKFSNVYSNVTNAKRTSQTYIAYDFDGNKTIDATVLTKTFYGEVSYTDRGADKGAFVIDGASDLSVNKDGKIVSAEGYASVVGDAVTVEGTMKDGIIAKWTVDGLTSEVTVAPADVVVGAFTGVSGSGSSAKYTVGGTTYQISADAISATWLTRDYDTNLGKVAILYTDGKYVVNAASYQPDATLADLPVNYAYLIKGEYVTGSQTNEFGNVVDADPCYKVQVMLMDGTVAVFKYAAEDIEGTELVIGNLFDGNDTFDTSYAKKVFEYRLNTKGEIVLKKNLTAVEKVDFYNANGKVTDINVLEKAKDAGYTVKYNKDKKLFTTNSSPASALSIMNNADALIFAEYTNSDNEVEYKIVKMADVLAGTYSTFNIVAATKDGICKPLIMTVKFSHKNATSNPYVLITGTSEKKVEGTDKYTYVKAVDLGSGETKEYKCLENLFGNLKVNGIYKLSLLNGVVQTATQQTWNGVGAKWTYGRITATASGLIVMDEVLYELTADNIKKAKVILKDVDDAKKTVYTLGTLEDLEVAAKDEDGEWLKNVLYVIDGETNKVTNIIIDLDGDLVEVINDNDTEDNLLDDYPENLLK